MDSMTEQEVRERDALSVAERFFYVYSSFGYDPKVETRHEGRMRCARDLARCERVAANRGYVFRVEVDRDGAMSACEFHAPDTVYYSCAMYDVSDESRPKLLASLGGIDVDEFSQYMRTVRAELAFEVIQGASE